MTMGPDRAQHGRRWTEDDVRPPVDLRLVLPAASCWAGAIAGLLSGAGFGVLGIAVAAASAICWLVTLIGRRPVPDAQRGIWRYGTAAAVTACAAGIVIAGAAVQRASSDPTTRSAAEHRQAAVTVRIAAPPILLPNRFGPDDQTDPAETASQQRFRVTATLTSAIVGGRTWRSDLTISVIGTGPEWSTLVPGSVVRTSGLLRPDSFPVIDTAALRATTAPITVTTAPWWSRTADEVRRDLRGRAAALTGDAAGLLPGLVIGDTSGIDERLDADAKATGLTHLLAVSGSHFAIVCGAVVLVVRRLVGPRVAAVGGALTLLALVVLVGPQPSVLRAAVMGGISVFALLIGRSRSGLPALAAAVVVLLACDPAMGLSPGFALSVLATAGLVLLAPVASAALRRRGWPRGWAELVAIPLAATVATLPVIAALSSAVSPVAVLANIAVAPVVPPALIIGLLAAILGPMSPGVADLLVAVDAPLLRWIAAVAHTMAGWPAGSIPWPSTLPWVLLLAGLLIGTGLLLRHRRPRALLLAVAVGAGAVLVPVQVVPAVGWPPPGWLLAGCEVGQGDAFVLSTDRPGSAVVVDTGPEPDLVRRCLDDLDIGTVPLLVLTHLHADHVDGLAGALAGRTVGTIGVGPGREIPSAFAGVQGAAARRGVPLRTLRPGDAWQIDGLTLQVYAPAHPFAGTESDPNNDSVVLLAEHRGVRMLLTGDIETPAQRALLRSGDDLDVDVLKVPHHGSAKDLPQFLAATSPAVAMIGVGRGNDYGHPSGRLLDRLTDIGVGTVLRTDTDGDIAVGLVDGNLTATRRGARLAVA